MDLKEHNLKQIEEMQKHKWIESEKAGYDLGEAACVDWVNKYAAQWREEHPIETDKLPSEQNLKADDGVSADIS
jgi:hypothetical protein